MDALAQMMEAQMESVSETDDSYSDDDQSMAHRKLETENTKLGIDRGINQAEINWVEATWMPPYRQKKQSDRTEKRVTLWNKTDKRKLSGNAAPFKSNLAAYLSSNPVRFAF